MPEKTVKHQFGSALFMKGSLFGGIFVVFTATHNAVTSFDPRCRPAYFFKSFATQAEAKKAFDDHVALTRDRGWSVVFNGRPNNAQLS